MASTLRHVTHESLLVRLQNVQDAHAWERFYATYRNLIITYARRRGCTEQMAQDVLQETLITLTKAMPSFRYDRLKGRFRQFLLRIVNSRLIDAVRREKKHTRFNADAAASELLAVFQDQETPVDEWAQEWDKAWEQQLLMEALVRVKEKVQPHVYQSFTLYVLEKKPVEEVAAKLGISRNTIYEQRRRLVAMIKREVDAIRADWGES